MMAAMPPRPWTVSPHGPLEKVEPNLWLVDGWLPKSPIRRRMAIVRCDDGQLVFHNAVPLEPAAMAEVEAWGRPSVLVVPNAYHRLDIHAFKERYPGMRLLCPAAIEARVGPVAAVDGHLDALPGAPALRAEPLDGVSNGEAVLVVGSGGRVSLLFADVLMNNVAPPGLGGLLLRLIGSAGGPRVTRLARLLMVRDRAALRAHLLRLAALPGLTRLVPSHGTVTSSDSAAVLAAVAVAL